MSFLPGLWRAWVNRSASGPFLNADNLNDMELKFRALDCLGALRAISLVDALPGSPADGDAYLTSAAATPANKIVRRFNGTWEAFTPINGMVAFLADGSAKQFAAGAWGDASFGGGGGSVTSVFGRTGAVTAQTGDYTPEQVGAAPAVHTHAYIPTSQKGAANGVAELGADGKVPSAQLPSYVDDVLEYANFAAFPATGETGKIYVNQDQNKTWRWSGSAYVEISASLALGETFATAYRGDRGKTAYDHSQATGNPHGTTAADVGALAASSPNFTGAMSQSGAERITSGGDGRFASVRGADLANTDSSAVFADANGNLQKTPHLSLSLVNGPHFGVRVGLVSAFYNSTSGYLATSLRMGPDDVAESNDPLGVESGDFWNSKRYHAIGIADGAVGARYLGRLRADRWTGTSAVSISGTTSATSWFAAGTGAGSPTLPANYLQGGRRVRAKGRVSCQSCAADTAPELSFLIGSTTIKTQAKAFTIASGNAIYVDVDVDFWADGDGYLVAVGDIKFYSPAIGGTYEYKINYAGAYDGSSAKTIDATIKPSSSGETWARNMAFVEA